jgi:hypothetical protein
MPLFIYRCPKTRRLVQGFSAEDTSEDQHVYEPMTCPVCHQVPLREPGYRQSSGRRRRIERLIRTLAVRL